MSSTFEEWEKAKRRRNVTAYFIARAVAAGLTPRQDDIDKFKAAEAQMRELETKFTEET